MPHAHLSPLLRAAATGQFPPADGGWQIGVPWRPGVGAVLAFTGHAIIVPLRHESRQELETLGIDGFGGATMPHVITALAGPTGWIDNLDVLLIRPAGNAAPTDLNGPGRPTLVARPDLHDHPRAIYNRRLRDDVTVYGTPEETNRSMLTVGRGIGGLLEIGLEASGRTSGADLLAAGLRQMDDHEPVVAAVAPGNARALRTFLAAGFRPVGSIQLCTATRP